jgi:hypothetical protein
MTVIKNLPGSFYIGKKFDLQDRRLLEDQVHYESKHLTTHALCVGMTGSGKTGLCIGLLEEAALDGIPIICVDPKGDLGNLLLDFPEMRPSDFRPWLDRAEALANRKDEDKDLTDDELLDKLADKTASTWSKGIADWNMDDSFVAEMKKVEKVIYTPGSNVGVPLTVLSGFDAPSEAVREDDELLRDQVSSATSGLLSLLGITADPLNSREHILISTILMDAWKNGRDLSMEELIRRIQSPPVKKIGVIDIDSFYPVAERGKLAMLLNNLLASPSFAGWMQGQSLDIQQLFYDSKGKAKISIISIAHLNDSERMFFITILLNELLSWMRSQPGTGALRAIFYMDEVYGYFPPSAKPPSKGPMMTLLKQARAFGLGIVLATQNPVDLDYKGLSNMGTWFLGRLQTQRDKDRVLDGLEGAALQQGSTFDRNTIDKTLSSLGKRVFLMNNANDSAPTIFQTRWALSYLRGPLAKDEIKRLMDSKRKALSQSNAVPEESSPESAQSTTPPTGIASESDRDPSVTASASSKSAASAKSLGNSRPIVPAAIDERFLAATIPLRPNQKIVLRPALLAVASVHFVRAASNVDRWTDLVLLSHIDDMVPQHLWDEECVRIDPQDLQYDAEPDAAYPFADLPPELLQARNYKDWEKELAEYLFRHEKCLVYSCKAIKQTTAPGLEEFEARIELSQYAREGRDQAMEKIRAKYVDKLRTLQSKVLVAQQRLGKVVDDAKSKRMDGLVNIGASILGSLLGNKGGRGSSTSSAVRDLAAASSKQSDIERAQESYDDLVRQKDEMERECRADIDRVEHDFAIENLVLDATEIPLRKADTKIKQLSLAWVPWGVDPKGITNALIDTIAPKA